MTMQFPQYRAVADQALLVEFDHVINDEAYADVISLDAKLAQTPFIGFTESVPAYVSLLVVFDALITDHANVENAIKALLATPAFPRPNGILREVEICYDPDLAPDLAEVAQRTGLTGEAVISAHLSETYRVFMYGFAPGYAYLNGVSPNLHLPRKPSAKRAVPAGSVIIAGGQCLITTLTMPTGWWIVGQSPTRILRDDPNQPFLFNVGDQVRFNRINRQTFDAKTGAQ
jgi:inhibitor of KinA